jgi:hypothetical protein
MRKKSGGDGSRTNQYHGKTYGRPIMPQTSMIKNEFESWEQGRDQPSEILPGTTGTGFINTTSRKSEMVKLLDSGRMCGNRNLKWKIQIGRSSKRKCLHKEKQQSITTKSQEMIVTDGGPGTNLIHKIETVSKL